MSPYDILHCGMFFHIDNNLIRASLVNALNSLSPYFASSKLVFASSCIGNEIDVHTSASLYLHVFLQYSIFSDKLYLLNCDSIWSGQFLYSTVSIYNGILCT